MRTAKIEIAGKEYMAVMNNRVLTKLEALGLKMEQIQNSETPVTNVLTLLRLMIESGSRYAKMTGMGEWPTISQQDLEDLTDTGDYGRFIDTIAEIADGDRHVDAEPEGNAEAGQAQAREN